MKRFAVLLALLVLAAIGSLLPSRAPHVPSRIGKYWVLEGDMHVHTSLAGAIATPVDIPPLAARRNLDFIAVTEHNAWLGGALARAFGHWLAPSVIVIPSEEVTNQGYHLLAIGLSSRVDPRLPLHEIAAETHRQGGVVIAAHPTRETWPLLLGLAADGGLDGAELFHPTMRPDYLAFREAVNRPLIAAGDSDYHGGSELGAIRTIVLAESRTAEGILDALRARRAVALAHDGRMAGDPETLDALQGYSPAAPSPVSWPSRVLGVLALLVLVASPFRRKLLGVP